MRFAFLFLFAACTSHPPTCPDCNPPTCPDPNQVVPNATCSVAPLVCPTPCNMKCQCWPDDAGVAVWTSTTPCEGGIADATSDADASDASDAGDAD